MATMETALTCNEYWEERLRTIMECACHCLNVRETTGFGFRESFQRMQWNEKMKILEGLNGLFVGVEGSEKNAVAETGENRQILGRWCFFFCLIGSGFAAVILGASLAI
ncbi:Uncharacterized protein Fot_51785 [Forsythia ovata]|uniref:Uncharacterized protein n=1 Tax=Forsythia ovata TaxID=205694 RepID=A0ABD1PWE5_9LAMI